MKSQQKLREAKMILSGVLLPFLISCQTPAQQPAAGDKISIKDDVVGKGPVAHEGDVVTVDLVGTLKDGTEFETTKGNEPLLFYLGQNLIKGWDMGVEGMHEGGTREITVPPSLAFGSKAAGPVPPNSTLFFRVALRHIEPKVEATVLVKGSGPHAKCNDLVELYLKGSIKDGPEVFNSRLDDKDPVHMMIGDHQVPVGFIPSLVGMQEGETRRVTIPPSLAYGSKGVPRKDQPGVKAGSKIPPNTTMIFTFELVKLYPTQIKD